MSPYNFGLYIVASSYFSNPNESNILNLFRDIEDMFNRNADSRNFSQEELECLESFMIRYKESSNTFRVWRFYEWIEVKEDT